MNSLFPLLVLTFFVSGYRVGAVERLKAAPVNPNDICQIVAPLSPGNPDYLNAAIQFVSDFGLTPQVTENIYDIVGPNGTWHWYSNTDEFRARDLADAILSEKVKMIWMINGGSGAYRTLQELELLLPPPPLEPKLIIGFSAATPIFYYLQDKYNWPTMHGAVLDLIVTGYYENSTSITIDPLRELIFGEVRNTTVPELTRIDNRGGLERPIVSTVVGGSMRQTAMSIGTEYRLNATGKILFFEMYEQDANSIQDFLDTLLFTGAFDGVVAIVFGDLLADWVHPDQVEWMLNRFAREEPRIQVPVFRLRGIGHAFENHPLPFNTRAEIRRISSDIHHLIVDNVF